MDNIAKKLGIKDPAVLSKAKEIEKLIDTKKSAALDLTASLQCVLSLQVAARMKGIEFEKELAIKTAATKKKFYDRMLFTVEKLLDLEPLASVKEMCLKLGISHLAKDAEKLRDKFSGQADSTSDVDHPMYSAGAVWVVAKSQKTSIEKAKILELARTNWAKLETVCEKMKKLVNSCNTPESTKKVKPARKHLLQELIENISENIAAQEPESCTSKENKEEDYDVWRKRMIKEAQEEMKQDFNFNSKKMKL